MYKNNVLNKGWVVIVILLFVGMSMLPVSGSIVEKKSYLPTFYNENTSYVDGSGPNNYSRHVILSNGWNIETVDSEGVVGLYTSIALDQYDAPHIIYQDATEAHLGVKYAHKVESNWSVEVVDSQGESGWANTPKSIAIDSDGYPHIVYHTFAEGNRFIKYAKLTDEGWNITIIAKKENDGELPVLYPTIALDSADTPHIAYIYDRPPYNQRYGGVKYMTWNGSSWISEIVDSGYGQYSVTCPMIVVDSADIPHICYTQVWEFVKYAKRSEGGWSIETVDAGETWWSDIAIDSNDIPHISYGKFTHWYNIPYDLKYAWRSSKGWNNITLEKGDNAGTSIALDSNDYPHISYNSRYSNGRALKHTWWNGLEWIFSVVDFGDYSHTGSYSSTAIDSQDKPHISYYDGTTDEDEADLKYALGDNTVPDNNPPNPPTISGETYGEVGVEYEYTFNAVDPDGDDIYYLIDWGDNSTSYSAIFPSGEELTRRHRWSEQGMYTIKAMAIDFLNAESDWATLEVTMPVNQPQSSQSQPSSQQSNPLFFQILQRLLNIR